MKKIVILGGGSGTSSLIKGLKEYPVDITTIISVCDNGRSTGKLRKEFNMPAIGDLRQVLTTLSNNTELNDIFSYRLHSEGSLDNHTIGNLFMSGIYKMKNDNLLETVNTVRKLFNIKQQVLPLSENNLTLMATTINGDIIEGEEEITADLTPKKTVFYKEKVRVIPEALKALREADIIILSVGSLFTSILPTIICPEVKNILLQKKCPIIYICNLVTQPGETSKYKASDHIKAICDHLGANIIDAIIANNGPIKKELIDKYRKLENKEVVKIDEKKLKQLDLNVILSDLIDKNNNHIRYDSAILSFVVYSYIMHRHDVIFR